MSKYTAEHAFETFIGSLAEDIQSSDALEAEANYRLGNLQALLDSGKWIQDPSGNVYPADLGEADQQSIAEHSAYSILNRPPQFRGKFVGTPEWHVTSSIISNAEIVNQRTYPIVGKLVLAASQIIDSTILYN